MRVGGGRGVVEELTPSRLLLVVQSARTKLRNSIEKRLPRLTNPSILERHLCDNRKLLLLFKERNYECTVGKKNSEQRQRFLSWVIITKRSLCPPSSLWSYVLHGTTYDVFAYAFIDLVHAVGRTSMHAIRAPIALHITCRSHALLSRIDFQRTSTRSNYSPN